MIAKWGEIGVVLGVIEGRRSATRALEAIVADG